MKVTVFMTVTDEGNFTTRGTARREIVLEIERETVAGFDKTAIAEEALELIVQRLSGADGITVVPAE